MSCPAELEIYPDLQHKSMLVGGENDIQNAWSWDIIYCKGDTADQTILIEKRQSQTSSDPDAFLLSELSSEGERVSILSAEAQQRPKIRVCAIQPSM